MRVRRTPRVAVAVLIGILSIGPALVAHSAENPIGGAAVSATGGYLLDAWGGIHPFGGARPVRGLAYWPGWDIARGMAVSGTTGGWTLDGWGGIHPFGTAPAATGPYWPGQDLARGIVAAPLRGGWVLDAWGGIHPFGGAPRIRSAAYWPGQDLARALVLRPSGGGWLIDAWGGIHPFGGAPAAATSAYWPGFDVVRGAFANRAGPGGWVLDMTGTLHAFGGAPGANAAPLWPSQDLARGVIPDPATNGAWIVDAWGGIHPVGGAASVRGSAYWPGQDLVRGGATASGSSNAKPLPPRRRLPVLRTVTYSVAVRGSVHSDVNDFIAAVESTYADERGWAAAGFEFVRVPSGGELTVWLSEARLVPSFGAPCDSFYSCRQGSNAIINDDRFASGSPYWPGALSEYRHMVIDHETGHWIGFGHSGCGGPGQLAPVMMQQSKGLLGCVGNPWPLPSEIGAARGTLVGGGLAAGRFAVGSDSE